jgi:beta-lactamase regulating signal transducer with metallopeptidase domain
MNYAAHLFSWMLLQSIWQTAAIACLLTLSLRFASKGSARSRCLCAELHLAAAAGVMLLTLALSHATVAIGAHPATADGASVGDAAGTSPAALAWAWFIGALIAQGFVALRHFRLKRFVSSASLEAGELGTIVAQLSRGLSPVPKIHRAEVLCPMTMGLRPSIILLPRSFAREHPPDEVRAILAHEVAHVFRRDYSRNILHLLALSLLWWHPGAWWIYYQIRHERECACDDDAVRMTGTPIGLARGLFRLASGPTPARTLIAAGSGRLADRLIRLSEAPLSPPIKFAPLSHSALATVVVAISLVASAPSARSGSLARAYAGSAFSPAVVFNIRGKDPAGTFQVQMVRGRVIRIVLGQDPVPSTQVIQRGDTVTVIDRTGQSLLNLKMDPRGGFTWTARRKS